MTREAIARTVLKERGPMSDERLRWEGCSPEELLEVDRLAAQLALDALKAEVLAEVDEF